MKTRIAEINCCIKVKGKKFCADGSILTEDFILAYLSCDGKKVTTWRGQTISDQIYILSKRYCSNMGEDRYYLRFKFNGYIYSGFAICKSGIVKARRTKLDSIWS